MTHQRPVPDASVSPYPLHPEPHDEAAEPAFFTMGSHHGGDEDGEDVSRYTLAERLSLPDGLSLNVIGLGAAIGLGVAAVAGALLYSRRKPAAPRRPAKRAPKAGGDDKTKRGTADRVRVAGGEPYEVNYFARKHGLTTARARAIITQAGSDRAKANALAKKG